MEPFKGNPRPSARSTKSFLRAFFQKSASFFMNVRPARPDDSAQILAFIHDLAVFERAPDAVQMTVAQLNDALFGAAPRASALLVEHEGRACGFAVWYETFNTWTGKPGLYLEDLFITEAARGLGAGKAIFRYLARVAVERDCARLEFSVLDWNENAINFYKSRGAQPLDEWTKYRITGEKLHALAAGDI